MERFRQIKDKGSEAIVPCEKFRFNAPPFRQQLEALAGDRLVQILLPAGMVMKMQPIWLFGACYDNPLVLRLSGSLRQLRSVSINLSLLSECPNCGARFKVPVL